MELNDRTLINRGFKEMIHKLNEISKRLEKLCNLIGENNKLLEQCNNPVCENKEDSK